MALAYVRQNGINSGSAGTSVNFTLDCTGGDLVIVGAGDRGLPTGATLNGVAMTPVTNGVSNGATNARQFYMANPPTGVQTIVVSYGSSVFMAAEASLWSGFSNGVIVPVSSQSGSSTSVTSSSILSSSNAFVVDFVSHGSTLTVGGSQTQIYNTMNANSDAVSYRAGNGGSFTMTWSAGASSVWAQVAVRITPGGVGIEFDATSQNRTTSATSNTVSHTIGGSNRILLTFVECQNGDLVTGVTYNGVAMTQLGKNNISAFGFYNYIYYMIAPPVGTANIVVSASSSCTLIQLSESLKNVDQTTPIEANNQVNQTVSTTNPTGTVTSVSNDAWVAGSVRISNFQPTQVDGTLQRNVSSDVGYLLYDRDGTVGTAGAKTLDTVSAAQTWYFWSVAIKPVGAAPTINPGFFMLFNK